MQETLQENYRAGIMRPIGDKKFGALLSRRPLFYSTEQVGDKMKTLKVSCAALVLAFSLTIPAYAEDASNPNDVHQPGVVNPGGAVPPKPAGTPGAAPGTTPVEDEPVFWTLGDILLALSRIF